jgi:uncharacterized glyoxalase superfamily protein PhnB
MAVTPYLLYEDVGAALKFLSKAFGFRKLGTQKLDVSGKITHGAMQLGDDMIMMGCPGPDYRNPKRLGENTQSLYVDVDDVDKHCARARKNRRDDHRGARGHGVWTPPLWRRGS